MRSKAIVALIVLNVVLLGGLFFHNGWTQTAGAQVAKVPPPSTYLMVSGEVQGGNGGYVFIIDTHNNWLTARGFNANTSAIEDMQPIDLAHVFK